MLEKAVYIFIVGLVILIAGISGYFYKDINLAWLVLIGIAFLIFSGIEYGEYDYKKSLLKKVNLEKVPIRGKVKVSFYSEAFFENGKLTSINPITGTTTSAEKLSDIGEVAEPV